MLPLLLLHDLRESPLPVRDHGFELGAHLLDDARIVDVVLLKAPPIQTERRLLALQLSQEVYILHRQDECLEVLECRLPNMIIAFDRRVHFADEAELRTSALVVLIDDAADVLPYCLRKLEQILVLLREIDVIELVQNVQEALIVNARVIAALRLAYFAVRLLHSSRYSLSQYHILLVKILLRFLNQDLVPTLLRVLLLFLFLFVSREVIVIEILDQLGGRTNNMGRFHVTEGRSTIVLF